ncbi:hypothetical protein [Teredinibacter haidensis]|uniref:hypothetical protein n=1 Tax=Teredinibacter haidensis TaxID=2731755 RepID=UPI000A7741FB|nr:hypothetical protein [Teredinibacter haidensis]
MEELLHISKFSLPIIALLGLYIAGQQYLVNKTKIRLELYDRRFDIYDSIFSIFDSMLNDGKVNEKTFFTFEKSCHEAKFLLPKKIHKEVNKAHSLVCKWKRLNRQLVAFEIKNLSSKGVDDVKNEMITVEEEIESFIEPMTASFATVLKFEQF